MEYYYQSPKQTPKCSRHHMTWHHDPIPDATDDFNDLLDAKATIATNCEPTGPTTLRGQSHNCMGEDFQEMQRMLDASYNEKDEPCRQIENSKHKRSTSHQSAEMSKIAKVPKVSQRNLNEGYGKTECLSGCSDKGITTTLSTWVLVHSTKCCRYWALRTCAF